MSAASTSVPGLLTDVVDGLATLTLARPEKRNAVTHAMWQGIADVCTEWAGRPDVLVVVLRGSGDHFCAGADVVDMGRTDGAVYAAANAGAEAAIAALPQPTVAAIRGSCVGGGVQIAASADLRITDSTGRFGITPARLGILYPAPALERVVRLIGPSAAKHLTFSAELVDAARAERIGLVDEVLEPADWQGRVDALVANLVDRSLFTQVATKAMIDEIAATGSVSDETVRRWRDPDGVDSNEGIAAFIEKRRPDFRWRPTN